MTLSTFDQIAAITEHSAGFAEAARGGLDRPVEHCPDWTVADLVWHLTEVHWFWASIVEGPLTDKPDEALRPPRPDDEGLVDAFVAQAARLVQVLREADQSAPCWTWARWKQDVEFVTNHQVQEAAVHHWDAAHATGAAWSIEPEVAVDSVDEFVRFSVASEDDPDDPPSTSLDGTLRLRATDTGHTWTLTDGNRPGTAHVERTADDGPAVQAPAADLLLWLYGRREVDTSGVPDALVARFRAICFTD